MSKGSPDFNEHLSVYLAKEPSIEELMALINEPSIEELMRIASEPYTEEFLKELMDISERTTKELLDSLNSLKDQNPEK